MSSKKQTLDTNKMTIAEMVSMQEKLDKALKDKYHYLIAKAIKANTHISVTEKLGQVCREALEAIHGYSEVGVSDNNKVRLLFPQTVQENRCVWYKDLLTDRACCQSVDFMGTEQLSKLVAVLVEVGYISKKVLG